MSPEIRVLQQNLRADAEAGIVYWLPRPRTAFKLERSFKAFNTRFSDKPALQSIDANGYRHGKAFGKTYKHCRVLWVLVYGYWPRRLDHINGDKTDDRLVNLRDASAQENSRNCKRSAANTSGQTGVSRHGKKWRAYIMVDGKQQHLGLFNSKERAYGARLSAEKKHGFHKNHGRAP